MGDFDSILTCSIAAGTFQPSGYSKSASGVYDDDGNRVATQVSYAIDGWVQAANATAMAAALASLETACAAADGADFTITAMGVAKESITAAACSAGPHVKLAYAGEGLPTSQDVAITVEATVRYDADGDGVTSIRETYSVAVNVEGLKVWTLSGRVETTGDPAATDVVVNGWIDGEDDIAPRIGATPEGWQQTYTYSPDADDTACDYQVTQTELVYGYPSEAGVPANNVVDGERTVSTAYDAHNRRVVTYSYSFVGPYAEQYMWNQQGVFRALGGLIRASVSSTFYKTRSAQGTFEVIDERENGEVLELTETVSHAAAGPLLRAVTYPGTSPIIVAEAPPAYVYTQAGRAIGLRRYPQPPGYLFAAENLMEAPEITLSRPNDQEWETAWRFRFLFATQQAVAYPHARPGSAGNL